MDIKKGDAYIWEKELLMYLYHVYYSALLPILQFILEIVSNKELT